MLTALGSYGDNGNKSFIRGEDVYKLLQGCYSTLLDLLPDEPTVCLSEPSDRLPLTHRRLRQFVQSEFNLAEFGLRPGDRVGVLLPNGPELAVTIMAVVSQWCAAPINPTNTWQEIRAELQSTQARAIIILAGAPANEAVLEAVKTLRVGVLVITPTGAAAGLFRLNSHTPTPEWDDVSSPKFMHTAAPSTPLRVASIEMTPTPGSTQGPPESQFFRTVISPIATPPITVPLRASPAPSSSRGSRAVLLLHTSGTSGNKKLVPYTLDMVAVGAACIAASWGLSPSDVCLNMMPLFHIGGIMRNVFAPILAGGQTIACSGFDPLLFWDVAASSSFTWYYAAPTMHHAILMEAERRPRPLPVASVRFIANAAGALLPALAQALQQNFVHSTILTSYGMTEVPTTRPTHPARLENIRISPINH